MEKMMIEMIYTKSESCLAVLLLRDDVHKESLS